MLRALYDVERGGEGLAEAIEDLRHRACEAIAKGARTLVISDRDSDHTKAPIPSLLAVSAVHHHLVRTKKRLKVALVVESGDAREVHHIALLIGYGAAAVNPYLAFESIEDLIREGELTGIDAGTAVRNYLKALGKGVMKVMSKMGISTVGSYTGAQAFEAIGLSREVVDEYLTGTVSKLGGVGSGRARRGGQAAPPPRLPGEPHRARPPPPRGRRRVPVPPRGRTPPVHPGNGFPASAFDPDRASRGVRQVLRGGQPALPRGRHPARPVHLQGGRASAGSAARGGVRRLDLRAVQHRGDELRVDLQGSPRNHGDRHERTSVAAPTAAKAAKTPTGCTTRAGAAPSSRSPRADSGSPASTW